MSLTKEQIESRLYWARLRKQTGEKELRKFTVDDDIELCDLALSALRDREDAERLDWLFSELDDDKIAAKLMLVSDKHAMGGLYGIRVGDFKAAIDAARGKK